MFDSILIYDLHLKLNIEKNENSVFIQHENITSTEILKYKNNEKTINVGFVIPNNNNDIIDSIVNNKIFEGFNLHSIPFKTNKDMEDYYKSNTNSLNAGVIINPDLLSYTLRVDGSSIPDPSILKEDYNSLSEKDNTDRYLSLFTPLQSAIDQALIQLKTHDNTLSITSSLGKLPLKYVGDKVKIAFSDIFTIFLLEILFIFPVISVVQLIVSENESNIKSYLISIGMHPSSFWLSWLISNTIYLYVIALLMCIMFVFFKVFSLIIGIVVFIFFCIYCSSLVSFSLLFSTFFKSAKTAYSITDISFTLFVGTYLFFYLISKKLKLIVSIFLSPVSMGLGLERLIFLQKSKLSSFISVFTDFDVLIPLGILLWNTLFYFGLALIFDSYFSEKDQSFLSFKRKPKKVLKSNDKDSSSKYKDDIENYFTYQESFIEVKNIYKEFKTYKNHVLAVNNVSFKAYKNEIFCLLGHNGSGKSTLLKIMTGIVRPNRGIITYDGQEFNKNKKDIRIDLGICTQDNILFDFLTVEENIKIFSGLKGVKTNVDEVLKKVDLWMKKKTDVENLSGGQKRKLCIGIAILGNPKYIFLDEPTTGLDPVSRRKIWHLLSDLKKNKIILLTTHYMDEADILADRKLILSNGVIRCLGTSVYLKNHFNMMYHLNVQTNYPNDVHKIIQKIIPSAKYNVDDLKNLENDLMKETQSSMIDEYIWKLSINSTSKFKELFKELNKLTSSKVVKKYSIKAPSLEELFIQLTENKQPSLNKINSGTIERNNWETKEFETLVVNDYKNLPKPSEIKNISSLKKLFKLIGLRFKIYFRNIPFLFNVIIIPVILSIALFISLKLFVNNGLVQFNEREISPSLYNQEIWNFDIGNSNRDQSFFTRNKLIQKIEFNNITNFNNYTYSSLNNKEFVSSISGTVDNNSNYLFNVYYNETKVHSVPSIINYISNVVLGSKNIESPLSMKSHPFPYYNILDRQIILNSACMAVGMILIISLIKYGASVVRERKELIVKQLHLNGINGKIYWLYLLIPDFFFAIITCILIFAVALICKYDAFYNLYAIIIMIITFILCSLGSLLFQYCLSFLFKKVESAYSVLPVINIFCILVGYGVNSIISVIYNDSPNLLSIFNKASLWFQTGLSFLYPSYGIISIINLLTWMKFLNNINKDKYLLTILNYLNYDNGISRILIAVFLSIIFYWIILIILDKKYNKVVFKSGRTTRSMMLENEKYLKAHEQNVYDEYELTKNNYNNYPISVLNLQKVFKDKSKEHLQGPYKLVLENISFHIDQNECFGLLGPNGVGKTTTLNILSNSISPDYGDVFYDGTSMKNISNLNIGYCNQNDILWKELTLREHLEFFLELRGYPKKELKRCATQYINYCNLEEHQNKKINHLSGGTKRKLSVLLAVCGYPKYIILDEPTASMDPYTKRFIWDIIKDIKTQRQSSIIMTTHSMEEAKALCDRLTILLNGRLSCIGTPKFLTSTYATNYILDFESDVPSTVHEEIFENPSSLFHKVKYTWERETNTRYKYIIEKKYNIGRLFELLERAKSQNKINDYTITEASLEDIFLDFVNKSH
ncbi:P-loop containing nucleoside triphosphate hydrolase protein [Neocallimastix californiae]|uniref:p-loop containing nucleoside triphosphate hydrolase protein n=1 Tax=Neocallimastix californiae TaxID=1754190 RepID=A0A1Y2ACA2_9FUNG|nr:P-loop containing nucleoside triphosphate hydrolase protein [Neocallimastix californiae]|eukprot:ORY20193.1 P-loop containing nucleoside triphosphate hydrolase protein [Neocallimastix californiae]